MRLKPFGGLNYPHVLQFVFSYFVILLGSGEVSSRRVFFAADQPLLATSISNVRATLPGGNKPPGAIAIFLEPWHADVLEILEIRNNHGKEEAPGSDVVFALWISDPFMERVHQSGEWPLFFPAEVPGLEGPTAKSSRRCLRSTRRRAERGRLYRRRRSGRRSAKRKSVSALPPPPPLPPHLFVFAVHEPH